MNLLIHRAWVKFYYSEYVSYICINLSYQGFIDFKMITFGKKLRECREAKVLSQQEFAKMLKTSHSVNGRYERDEMVPSIEVVKKMADFLDTTVGYLLGETQEVNLFKDPDMFRRFNDINSFPEDDKSHIIYTLDAMINSVKLKTITQHR